MSKSGLYAHFDSKQDLQLATVAAAEAIYATEVLKPTMKVPEGLARLELLCEGYLSYVRRGVFPGGCFFASTAAEWDTRRGPIETACARSSPVGPSSSKPTCAKPGDRAPWPATPTPTSSFEINALLHEANGQYLLFRDPAALERAQTAIDNRIARVKVDRAPLSRGG